MGIFTSGFMARYAIIQCCRLQSRQRSLLLQVNHAKKAITNMEKQLKSQKNMQLQAIKNNALLWQTQLGSECGVYNGGIDSNPLSMNGSIMSSDAQKTYMQGYQQLQTWQSQQIQAIELEYEANLEALLEPLKQDEEDLECDKQDVDNDLAYWQEIRNSYKQQAKEDTKSFVT